MERVVLVDAKDNETGSMEKMEAHKRGVLHRAFSVLLFNSKQELLVQRRSAGKYHSAGLWANTCCSHPMPGESLDAAIRRKLQQEMGIDAATTFSHTFIYRVELDHGLIEHELDHVFVGRFEGVPRVNPSEVEDWRFESLEKLREGVRQSPGEYASWFKLLLDQSQLVIPVA